jgi:hypothetical protein
MQVDAPNLQGFQADPTGPWQVSLVGPCLGASAFYKAFGFVSLEGVSEGTLHGDPTAMFLPIKTILRALDSAENTGG